MKNKPTIYDFWDVFDKHAKDTNMPSAFRSMALGCADYWAYLKKFDKDKNKISSQHEQVFVSFEELFEKMNVLYGYARK